MAKQAFLFLVLALFLCGRGRVEAGDILVINMCDYDVWPAVLTNAGSPPVTSTTEYRRLSTSQAVIIKVPQKWSGRVWARTECVNRGGRLVCRTGDCGSGDIICNRAGSPPASRVDFAFDLAHNKDGYRANLADGFNVPFTVYPSSSAKHCGKTGCMADVNAVCPRELRVTFAGNGSTAGCNSPCARSKSPEHCCTGAFAKADKCKPTMYSQAFKKACPLAHTYPFDNPSTLVTCTNGDKFYTVRFCR